MCPIVIGISGLIVGTLLIYLSLLRDQKERSIVRDSQIFQVKNVMHNLNRSLGDERLEILFIDKFVEEIFNRKIANITQNAWNITSYIYENFPQEERN